MRHAMKRTWTVALLLLAAAVSRAGESQVRHSLVHWAFRVPLSYLMEQARPLDVHTIEVVGPGQWRQIQSQGFDILVADGADLGIERGFADPEYQPELIARYKKMIPRAAKAGIPYLICYSGLNTRHTSEEALEICARGLKEIVRSAEKNNVTLLLELYSSREGKDLYFKHSFPHYAADSPEWGARLCDRVGSPNLKLLYDVWQMYDMGRDVFSDVKRYAPYIAHYHVAGIEGRKPFTDREPLDFKALSETIYATGYKGFIGHEYMIEKEVPAKLKEAVERLTFDDPQPPFALRNWGDSLVHYSTGCYLPPSKYRWNWRDAVLLRGMADLYEDQPEKKEAAMRYVRSCMDRHLERAYGKHPNAVASALGLAFLARHTGDPKYMEAAHRVYGDYLKIPRTSNGGVSHRADVTELWDDTIYMIGVFLLEMYRATGDESYLDELSVQIIAHYDKLGDPHTGLWYHGWDNDTTVTDDGCCQLNWSANPQRRNDEFWGRGNGWIAMTLADCLATMPKDYPGRRECRKLFVRMMNTLLPLQDARTGHWLQLPVHTEDLGRGNFIESSCTAMFGYAMARGIETGDLPARRFMPAVERAHEGLGKYSIFPTGHYVTIGNVCAGTCIGDRGYYYRRGVVQGTEFALGAAILFDNTYRKLKKQE